MLIALLLLLVHTVMTSSNATQCISITVCSHADESRRTCPEFDSVKQLGNSSTPALKHAVLGHALPIETNLGLQSSLSKWVVITTVASPTRDVASWAALGGWRVVTVADLKTPDPWVLELVDHLSVRNQRRLPFALAHVLPYRSYARKMIGYLYAIQHGARVIFDTDDDNAPLPTVNLTWARPTAHLLVTPRTFFDSDDNVYSAFGQPDIWPRGWAGPIPTGCNNSATAPTPKFHKRWNLFAPVQQGLANLDPDVDAIWRLRYPERIGKVRFTQSESSFACGGAVSPWNSQNTVIHYDAFWALYLPVTVSMRVTDIWRSYWASKLLTLMDACVEFHAPTVDQIRNFHNYTADFIDEAQLYVHARALVRFLYAWVCVHDTLRACGVELMHDMASAGFVGHDDIALVKHWFQDLEHAGYVYPAISSQKEREEEAMLNKVTLVLRTTARYKSMVFEHGLASSLAAFWPRSTKLNIVMDHSNDDMRECTSGWLSAAGALGLTGWSCAKAPPFTFTNTPKGGHDMMQYDMLVLATTHNAPQTEYVGFIDTDTVFVARVTDKALFTDDGRPYIHGLVGKACSHPDWEQYPCGTLEALKLPETMRAMNYFPVIIKTEHLRQMIDHIQKLHNASFQTVFGRLLQRGRYSQFNIMANYLWVYHRSDYEFRLEQCEPGWAQDAGPCRIKAQELGALIADPQLTLPWPKVAVHWRYRTRAQETLEHALAEGFERSYSSGAYSPDTPHDNLWDFEYHNWASWEPRALAQQRTFYIPKRDAPLRFALVLYSCTPQDEAESEWVTLLKTTLPVFRPNCKQLEHAHKLARSRGCTETHGYLQAVIDNYENLANVADVLFFVHAHRVSWHYTEPVNEQLEKVMADDAYLRKQAFGNVYCKSNRVMATSEWGPSGKRDPQELWTTLFKDTNVDFPLFDPSTQFQYPCCGTFWVTSQSIKKRPVEVYQTVLANTLATTEEDNRALVCGRVAESAWHVLFGYGTTFVEKPTWC